jgi:hypothetical protein
VNRKEWLKDENGDILKDEKGKRIYTQENLEKVMIFAMQYLALRQVHSDEISNDEIAHVVGRINFTEYEIPEIYRTMVEELTNREFIFRIKRIKYVKNTNDSVMIVTSPLMAKLGKYLTTKEIRYKSVDIIDPIPDPIPVKSKTIPTETKKPEEKPEPRTKQDINDGFVVQKDNGKIRRYRILCSCGLEYGDGAWYRHRKEMKISGHEIARRFYRN